MSTLAGTHDEFGAPSRPDFLLQWAKVTQLSANWDELDPQAIGLRFLSGLYVVLGRDETRTWPQYLGMTWEQSLATVEPSARAMTTRDLPFGSSARTAAPAGTACPARSRSGCPWIRQPPLTSSTKPTLSSEADAFPGHTAEK